MWVDVQKARVALCPTGSSCSGSHMTQSNHVINAERVDGELSATNADEKSTAEAANVPASVDEDARDDVETEEEDEDEDEEDAFVRHRRSSTQTTFCCDCDEPTEVDCDHTPEVRRENVTCVSSIDPGGCRQIIWGLAVADVAPAPLNLKENMYISAFDEIYLYIIHVHITIV